MKALVFHGTHDLRYESTDAPRLESDSDVIVRVTKTALCGSDLHLWHGGLPAGEPGWVMLAPVAVPWAPMLTKSLGLHAGLVSPQRHITQLLALIESGRLDPAEIITHRLPLSEGVAAYEMFAERRDDVLKVVLTP